jgi:ribosomal protein S18 acetylase RimI-like enzyme
MIDFDANRLHPYQGYNELPKILQFVGECNALADYCGCLHPGDICHFLSNTLRGRDLEKQFYIHEDAHGQVLGLVLLYPARYSAFDVLVHPRHRDNELESSLIAWGEQQTRSLLQATGNDTTWIGSDVMDCDTIRRDMLKAQGYVASGDPAFCYTTRSLLEDIPASILPDGFTMRSVAGDDEAEEVQAVHAGSFGSIWQPGEYLNVMRTPGFHVDRELVMVAPDGRFAAFLIYWIDHVSKSGLFEPVGCHQDFQRLGLSRALMYEGMRRMVAHGMTTAVVLHQTAQKNPAAAALYRSVGFSMRYTIDDYRKQIT